MKVVLLIFFAATTAKAMSIADPSSQRNGQECSNIPAWMERSLSTTNRQSSIIETKIVGGPDALEPIPWQAHITIMKGGESFQCGGTILDEKTILSAAHCFHPFEKVGPVRVETGILINPLLNRRVNIDAKTSNVEEIINHPNYDDSTNNNDIAILRLKTPLTITKDSIIQPACLPDPSLSLEDEELGVVSGWGRTTRRISSQVSDNLKYVSLPVLSNDACSNWTSLYKTSLTDNMFCAGFREGGKDSCKGDSGGPFIVNGGVNLAALGFPRTSSSSSPAIIYGVVSFGPKLCGIPKVPGVYTLVTKYIPWITSLMKVNKDMSHTCPEGYTIPSSLVCDGTRHCTDSSDEIGCHNPEESTENIVSTTTATSTPTTTVTVTKFLITSGYVTKSEVIDLDQSGNKQCPDWPNFPTEVEGATGSLISGKPTICGGYPYTDKCFVVSNTESQFLSKMTMTTKRGYTASSQQEDYLWISGGHDGDNILSSTEKIHSDGRAIPGPDMPLPLWGHAMVKINETVTLIIGGKSPGISASKKTFYYNHKTSEWSDDGPEMKVGRSTLAAGIVTDDVTKEEFVVVSGGSDGSNPLKSTEVLMDNKWTLGPELPIGINGHSMVPLGSGQAIIGGYGDIPGKYQGKIYHFTCANRECKITKLSQELAIPRVYFVAIPIPDDLSGCT